MSGLFDNRRGSRWASAVFFLFCACGLAGPSLKAQRTREPLAPIKLAVDTTEAPRSILHAKLAIPVRPGPLTLYYPEWIPGEHMPDGPIVNLAGLKFTAGGKVVPWRRDLVDMFAIHLDVPEGASELDVSLDFLLSGAGSRFSSGSPLRRN